MSDVIESAVIGVNHQDFGEAVVAVIVKKEEASLSKEDIQSYVSDQLVYYKRPKHIEFASALPRNSMGKVQKNMLREQFKKLFEIS